jgi:hypothetical protein
MYAFMMLWDFPKHVMEEKYRVVTACEHMGVCPSAPLPDLNVRRLTEYCYEHGQLFSSLFTGCLGVEARANPCRC